jgi:hypothetical protein
MKKNLKIIITLVIAVAIVVPVGILAYTSYANSQNDPLNFVPSSSTFLVKVNYNGSTYYSFGWSKGFAIMLQMNSGVAVSGNNLSFNSTKIPVSLYGNYGGFTLYNISLSGIIYGALTNISKNSNVTDIPAEYFGNLSEYYSLYFYEPYSNEIAIGTLNEIKLSITSYNHGSNFLSKARYINNPGSLDFYFRANNSTTIWGNYSSNYTYLFINGNHTFISRIYNESADFSLIGYKMKMINSTTIEIIMPLKVYSRVR